MSDDARVPDLVGSFGHLVLCYFVRHLGLDGASEPPAGWSLEQRTEAREFLRASLELARRDVARDRPTT